MPRGSRAARAGRRRGPNRGGASGWECDIRISRALPESCEGSAERCRSASPPRRRRILQTSPGLGPDLSLLKALSRRAVPSHVGTLLSRDRFPLIAEKGENRMSNRAQEIFKPQFRFGLGGVSLG